MAQMGQGILEAGANAARITQAGYESMGKSLAGGINTAVAEYTKHKDDQAKFDATKKLFSAFEDYLPKQTNPDTGEVTSPMGEKIKSLFADTSMSVREKNQMAPMLFSFLGQAQQQSGRESVANIMAGNRLDVAALKNPPPAPRPAFNAAPKVDPLDEPVLPSGSSAANPQALQPQADGSSAAPYMIQRPPAQPQPVKGPLSNMPKTRQDPLTKKMQFWSPGAKRYIDESENELFFGPDFRITPY